MHPRAATQNADPMAVAARAALEALGLGVSGEPSRAVGQLPLVDFIPRTSPLFSPPHHLAPVIDVIGRALAGPVRALISVPPRHGKTETLLHAIPWVLLQHPEYVIGYVSYAADIARSKSRNARDYARSSGVVLRDDADALNEWRTPQGGGVIATGIGGPLTGHGVRILLVDDPLKNREEAESFLIRQRNHEWFTSTAMTRLDPEGSAIIVHTRWHEDDLIGRLKKEADRYVETHGEEGEPWEHINLQAISDTTGEALWSKRWPVDVLEKRRRTVGPYDWASLFQGDPRPREGKLFREPARYDKQELAGRRIGIGVDVAGTKSTKANWTVASVFAFADYEDDLCADVLDVLRLQEEIPEVCRKLEALQEQWGAPLIVEASGLGKAVPQTLRDTNSKLKIEQVHPVTDKWARAQSYGAAWNNGRVRHPKQAGWLNAWLQVHRDFTGDDDPCDDDVDAGAHVWNWARAQKKPKPAPPPPPPRTANWESQELGFG
jgi:predicted phage terminase large subunit-like protein